jgi:two-component system, OmpR family, sensor kinase
MTFRTASLRNKLALLFFLIMASAFGVIYFFVVPQLEQNLEREQMSDLRNVADASKVTLEGSIGNGDIDAKELDRRVRAVADATGARLTLLSVQRSKGARPIFFPLSDSREDPAVPDNATLAEQAVRTKKVQTGFSAFESERLGQLAQPLTNREREVAQVALYSRSFDDVAETVSFVRERVLGATVAALVLALIGGYLVAQALSRRVGRLERAAREVSAGRFVEPLPVTSADELGQLTRAFNEMQARLRRVDVARKEFVATASHELRTPIFSLGGFVELLQDEELDDETRREFIETMSEQVARLQKLSVDLLDLSRMDAGSLELNRDTVDLSELAQSVLMEFTPAMAEHDTELATELPEAGVEAHCDRQRVAQIMRILLDNALRHTPEGTQVTVSANRNNGAAELTVADTGPGPSDGTRGELFERFYTGDATRGAGLGLAIARELAERMDGTIELYTRPGKTSFKLELPPAREGLGEPR